MRVQKVNSLVTHKRRAVSSGNKKQESTLQTDIPAFVSDQGTTADHEQTYLIIIDTDDITSTVNPDTDTLSDDNGNVFKIENVAKKTYHYSCRCIKSI